MVFNLMCLLAQYRNTSLYLEKGEVAPGSACAKEDFKCVCKYQTLLLASISLLFYDQNTKYVSVGKMLLPCSMPRLKYIVIRY